ncbi:uncharacterized protein [Nicotiana tomentosiformis]|uniref:uncharacterized protein n=1 Tax=Nicotiana tomentosiformis TaxID=4098 RepID=UPI00051B98ED|nr:uncharacterized protein LOC117279849 [Nicotiana tomentosiformis]
MHASDTESVELASYQLRDVTVQWYGTWELSRGTNAPPAVWEEFSGAFLRHYLPAKIRQARVDSMDISRIQDYAQNLEDQKRQQYEDCGEDRCKRVRSARQLEDFQGDPMPPYSADSVRQLQRSHYEGSVYSESGHGSISSGFSESEGFSIDEGASSAVQSMR